VVSSLATRAVEIVLNERLREHEAAHAAAALLLGLRVAEVRAPHHALYDVARRDPDEVAGIAMIERRADIEGLRKYAVSLLAGHLQDGDAHWPPRWPLSLAPERGDEADLCKAVGLLGIGREGYGDLVQDA